MSRGTKLDRSDWATMQHGAGVPGGSTKGNQYLDDSTGVLWKKAEGGSWDQDSLWTKIGSQLNPAVSTDGLAVNGVGGGTDITLVTDQSVAISGNSVGVTALGTSKLSLTAVGNDIDITTGAANALNLEASSLIGVTGGTTIHAFSGMTLDNDNHFITPPGASAFIKIGAASGTDPLHLFSAHSDILIETVAASCTTDIKLMSCDDILADADGEISLDSKGTSNFSINATTAITETLTLSCSNGGTGDGNVTVSGSDDILLSSGGTLTASIGTLITLSVATLNLNPGALQINGNPGATGSFTAGANLVTVEKGIITSISGV
jgi:hypothetical protein